ncbi:pyrroline-5-carboxylate reductase [Corynebacterium anserum]|uniref:Pyrroline-5-carboxylate reductase n=1 Tax=Corynebacterium anserum TaxID=2684406 RepID=A0A7G7YQ76_9CORY|nr:pyrroline-5-carboxylate reductase [Corynebacterium anserum]QNH96646.1 pyrroline-5-carboxylate reductase [Corynebacterium anserum]
MTRIGIIGGGNIGEALLSGIIGNGTDSKNVIVSDPAAARLEQLKEKYGLITTEDSQEAADGADFLFICVKPDIVPVVLESVAETVEKNDNETVIVSVAAGVTINSIETLLPAGTPVVRVMPNTPMLVGKGASALAGGRFADEGHVEAVQEIMSATGTVVKVKEKDIDAVTAVSGSGPAYFFMVTEAMIDAGVNLGLPRPLAQELAIATADGAAQMMAQGQSQEGGDDPVTLRTKVSSPGGTTSAATRVLDEEGLRRAFYKAMEACKNRSVELGES